jgi:pSer/pThr/pTyr-binding forkhead associated (FHA) protein
MSKLMIRLSGQVVAELQLEVGKSYKLGRGSNCDVILPSVRGVSREHFGIVQENGIWQLAVLAKFGELIVNGDSKSQQLLTTSMSISSPPFEIQFEDQAGMSDMLFEASNDVSENSKMSMTAMPTRQIPTSEIEKPQNYIESPVSGNSPDLPLIVSEASSSYKLNDERTSESADATQIAQSIIVPFIIIKNTKTQTEETLKLEGQKWVCGRQDSNEITINDSAISRRHFQIIKEKNLYFIQDCDSSNGTHLNGDLISKDNKTPLFSGDLITVRHLEIKFEIRNAAFDKMLQLMPPREHSQNNLNALVPTGTQRGVVRLDTATKSPKNIINKIFANKVRGAIVVIILLAIIYSLTGTNGEQNLNSVPPGGEETKSITLTDDQMVRSRDAFNLAKNHYNLQKFELCLAQLELVHNITPSYETSKELENLCRQGKENQQLVLDRDRLEKEKVDVENKIASVVSECRQRINKYVTVAEIEDCLQSAYELDPQNSSAVALKMEVEAIEKERVDRKMAADDFARRQVAGKNVFQNANSSYKSGNMKQALKLYSQFLKGNYPGLNQEMDSAKRQLASINRMIEDEINKQLSLCDSALANTRFKEAYLACTKVLREYPNNVKARDLQQQSLKQMNKQMKELYDNAVVEESYGAIDPAKKKWQEIVDTAVPQSEYFSKAKGKLKKYGL